MVIRPEHLRGRAPAAAGRVESERTCRGCGYCLRGLPLDGRCPECGRPVQERRPRDDDPLSLMPIDLVRRFRRAVWLATACVLLIVACAVARPWLRFGAVDLAWYLVVLAVLWSVAAVLLTPALDERAAIEHGFGRRGRLRQVARVLSAGWTLAAGVLLVRVLAPKVAATTGMHEALTAASWAGVVSGALGVSALAVHMERLAEWACDREAAAAFGIAAWGVPVMTVLILLIGTPVAIAAIVLLGVWVVVVVALPYGLLSLSRSMAWTVTHAMEHEVRLLRRQARAEEDERRLAARLAAMDAKRAGLGKGGTR